ncbi:hypothetical protein BDN72DRAFT_436576 [Pluteus cervinus]|uniref:Uncharacterized protein n=1 Tax=Pluteus cervinus TaxID=181527 RepID=A0ACD3B113_9AGAR|nr:hypothetical protein BDN72DRAFT_436576 [Pluteus cervinus]
MAPWILLDDVRLWSLGRFSSEWFQKTDLPQTMLGTATNLSWSTQFSNHTPTLTIPATGTRLEVYGNIPNGTQVKYGLRGGIQETPVISTGNETMTSSLIWSIDLPSGEVKEIQWTVEGGAPTIDYVLVTGQDKLSQVETLIIDDRDDWLQFKGSWVQEVGPHTTFGSAFQNTRTGSRMVGDQMKFVFIGSSLGVYGVTNPGSGKLAFNVSLDGAPPVTHIQSHGTQPNESSTWSINQELFYMNWGNDHPERHELTITVHETTESQILWLDYIIFESNDSTEPPPPPSPSNALASPSKDKPIFRIIYSGEDDSSNPSAIAIADTPTRQGKREVGLLSHESPTNPV